MISIAKKYANEDKLDIFTILNISKITYFLVVNKINPHCTVRNEASFIRRRSRRSQKSRATISGKPEVEMTSLGVAAVRLSRRQASE